MSYVVLARKWRPMSFRDLIGQEHVTRILANAIEQQRVAHAFLFTGVRGVGKTTSARILAKALNCLDPNASGTPGEPCLRCSACTEITEGVDVDVREIDGASYTGVDEIRKLQESLPYRPVRDRYKIFIVDEVHMLSQNAWNALLKTLEEPPPHVKFIFATTEVHKVPVTILSRVQRFDFKMIATRAIVERLRHVLTNEGISADDRAVSLVAREAAGSMRDALSLLDQVIAFNPKELLGEDVARVLGLAGYLSLLDIVRAVLGGQVAEALQGVASLANQSCELTVAARDLLGILRDLVVAKLCPDAYGLLDLSDEERQRVRELAQSAQADDLIRLQQGFAKGFDEVSRAADPRTALEMLLVRASARPPLLPLEDLMAKLLELEARLGSGKPPVPAAPSPGRPSASAPPPSSPPARGGARAASSSPASVEPRPSVPKPPAPAVSAPSQSPAVPERSAAPAEPRPPVASALPPVASSAQPPIAPAPPPAPMRATAPASAAPMPPPAAALAALPPGSSGDLLTDWRRVLDALVETRPDLVAFLKHSVPMRVDAEVIHLGYEAGNVLEASIRSPACQSALSGAAERVLGKQPKVTFQPVSGGVQTLAETDKRARELERAKAVDRAEKHESVRAAAEILGARVKRIELSEG